MNPFYLILVVGYGIGLIADLISGGIDLATKPGGAASVEPLAIHCEAGSVSSVCTHPETYPLADLTGGMPR